MPPAPAPTAAPPARGAHAVRPAFDPAPNRRAAERKPTRRDPLYLTWEEYLDYEERSERRHEWVNGLGGWDGDEELGEVRPVSGYDDDGEPAMATRAHAAIISNLNGLLWTPLRGTGLQTMQQCMMIRSPGGPARYPDMLIAPDPARFARHAEAKELTLLNPVLLFEVLSDSTEDTDRGDKLEEYAAIPTVTDYLIVSQHEPRVEHHVRVADGWRPTVCEGPDAVVTLAVPAVQLKLADVYERVFAG